MLALTRMEISRFKHSSKSLNLISGHCSHSTTHLESVILGWVVTCGNHHTTFDFEICSGTVECPGRTNSKIVNVTASRHQPIDESLVKFRSRLSDVSSDRQCSTIEECRQCLSQAIGECRCQLRTCNTANVVGLERLKCPLAHGRSTGTLLKVTAIHRVGSIPLSFEIFSTHTRCHDVEYNQCHQVNPENDVDEYSPVWI